MEEYTKNSTELICTYLPKDLTTLVLNYMIPVLDKFEFLPTECEVQSICVSQSPEIVYGITFGHRILSTVWNSKHTSHPPNYSTVLLSVHAITVSDTEIFVATSCFSNYNITIYDQNWKKKRYFSTYEIATMNLWEDYLYTTSPSSYIKGSHCIRKYNIHSGTYSLICDSREHPKCITMNQFYFAMTQASEVSIWHHKDPISFIYSIPIYVPSFLTFHCEYLIIADLKGLVGCADCTTRAFWSLGCDTKRILGIWAAKDNCYISTETGIRRYPPCESRKRIWGSC